MSVLRFALLLVTACATPASVAEHHESAKTITQAGERSVEVVEPATRDSM